MALLASAGTLIGIYVLFLAPKTHWIIDASTSGLTFDLRTVYGTSISKDSPPGWEGHPGWFVFADHAYAWAYDGADMVLVEEVTPKTINGYMFAPHRHPDWVPTWGVIPKPPKEVFDRLPSKIQAVILQKYPSNH
jgi:hypothetical protein